MLNKCPNCGYDLMHAEDEKQPDELDKLYARVVPFISSLPSVSPYRLQSRFHISYAVAVTMVKRLTDEGLIAPLDSQNRQNVV